MRFGRVLTGATSKVAAANMNSSRQQLLLEVVHDVEGGCIRAVCYGC